MKLSLWNTKCVSYQFNQISCPYQPQTQKIQLLSHSLEGCCLVDGRRKEIVLCSSCTIPIPLQQKALHLPVILFNNLSWKTIIAWASLIWLVGLNFDICSLSKSLPSHFNKALFSFFFLFIFKFYSPGRHQKNPLYSNFSSQYHLQFASSK